MTYNIRGKTRLLFNVSLPGKKERINLRVEVLGGCRVDVVCSRDSIIVDGLSKWCSDGLLVMYAPIILL
jgi:hypothetical protein